MIKGPIFQDDITLLNVYASNNRSSKFCEVKMIELQGEIDKSTIIVSHFNTSLSEIEPASTKSVRT